MFKYITRQAEVDELLPVLMSKKAWGFDCEAPGLDPHTARVMLVQFGTPEAQYVVDTRKCNIEPLRPFLESTEHRKVGHHLLYDYQMIKGSFGIEVECLRCTYIGEKLLHNGRPVNYKLDQTLKRRKITEEVSKELQKSFADMAQDAEFTPEQIKYAAQDVRFMLPLGQQITQEMKQAGMERIWLLECDAIPAFGDMEYAGVLLDQEKWKSNIRYFTQIKGDLKEKLNVFASPYVFTSNLFGEEEGIDWDSPKQVLKLLKLMGYRVPTRDPRTGEEVMEMISSTDMETQKKLRSLPMIRFLQKYRSAAKMLGSYGENYIQAINPKTGRIHQHVDQVGAGSGRQTNRGDVTLLGIPRDDRFRNAFIAAPGWVIETDDQSNCELRIIAELSGERRFIEPFSRGEDVHCAVASDLFGEPVERHSPKRAPGKRLNLGLTYGMGIDRLCDEINAEGYPITWDETRSLRERYVDRYRRAVEYLRDVGATATRQGWIANRNGRRRLWTLPDSYDSKKYPSGTRDERYKSDLSRIRREASNHIAQSVCVDMMKEVMVECRKFRKAHGIRTEISNQLYDELDTHTHSDDSPKFVEAKRRFMKEVAERWMKSVPMVVDSHVGPYWKKG